MAKSLKQLMGMSEQALIALGSQYGLTFHEGMKKSHMAAQIEQSAASGWMEVNQELMSGVQESADEAGSSMTFEGYDTLSDAAHLAQIISGAGYTEAFHEAMNGPSHHAEAVASYLENLGVSTDDVWMHMPKPNPNLPPRNWGALNSYLRDGLTGHQDIMPEIAGHAESNFMDEFSTNKGGVQQSYEYLAHMYVNREQYDSEKDFNHDISLVTTRLQSELGSRFKEVAFASATGTPTSYIEALPYIGNPEIVKGVQHPRQALNVLGLPYGQGVGLGGATEKQAREYSLSASLTGQPGWSEVSRGVYSDLKETTKSLAKVYSGDSGLSANKVEVSDRDQILDSASRYADIFDVRHGYENLKRDEGDEPNYSKSSIRAVLENTNDYNEAETSTTFDPAQRIRSVMSAGIDDGIKTGNSFTADFKQATFSNPAYERREAKRIADLDASYANFRDTGDYGSGRSSDIQYHNVEQGSQEWLELRSQYDITGSTVGSMLGNNSSTRPWAEMVDRIGLKRGAGSKNNTFTQRMFAAGHATEESARKRVSDMLGMEVKQTGAISNTNYPGMLYSPDGLIGDDALWEHKNPENARAGFADLLAGDHPDYMDQIQMGMLLSGRKRTLFSQTRAGESRDQWIDADPTWYERNRTKLDSIRGRLAAGRRWLEENPGADDDRDRINGARSAMTGEGLWRDVSQRSNRGFSATAGTENDPFVGRRSDSNFGERSNTSSEAGQSSKANTFGMGHSNFSEPRPNSERSGNESFESGSHQGHGSDYKPNWTYGGRSQVPPELLGIGHDPNVSSNPSSNPLSNAVKEGILAAQEENRQKGSTQNTFDGEYSKHEEDADFTDNPGSGRGGGGGRRGGGGGGKEPPDWFTGGTAGGDIIRGIAGGSISSATSGAMSALARTPWGLVAGAAIGAVSIGNEVAENINEFVGTAEDAGLNNPNEYSSMGMGLQQLGLSEQQANRVNQTTHSAYNTLLNGDPSGAIRIVQGTRGLVTIGDIRSAEGDPVALARIIRERGAERGWSQARIAGAMEMAGLQGMARAANRTEYAQDEAEATVQAGRESSYAEGIAANDTLQAQRGNLNVAQNALQTAVSYGAPVMNEARNSIIEAKTATSSVKSTARTVYDFIMSEESGGNDLNSKGEILNSGTGAKGRMQVTDSTMRDPGLPGLKGINPETATLDERAQFGRDYYDALVRRYDGDHRKAQAAYTDGMGTVDNAVKSNGDAWLTAMPQQAKTRVSKYDEWAKTTGTTSEGASGFTRNGVSYGQSTNISVNINAKVNSQVASATVSTSNGQTVNQVVNMGNGANQLR